MKHSLKTPTSIAFKIFSILVLGIGIFAGCGGDESSPTQATCAENATQQCPCMDGSTAVQICLASGIWSECPCSDVSTSNGTTATSNGTTSTSNGTTSTSNGTTSTSNGTTATSNGTTSTSNDTTSTSNGTTRTSNGTTSTNACTEPVDGELSVGAAKAIAFSESTCTTSDGVALTWSLELEQATGLTLAIELDVNATVSIVQTDAAEVLPKTTVTGSLEHELTLDAGNYTVMLVQADGEAGTGTLTLTDGCSVPPVDIDIGNGVDGSITQGHCALPQPSDRYMFETPNERTRIHVRMSEAIGFTPRLELTDASDQILAEGTFEIDINLVQGQYALRVFTFDDVEQATYRLDMDQRISDCMADQTIAMNTFVEGTIDPFDCRYDSDGDMFSVDFYRYNLENPGWVRHIWIADEEERPLQITLRGDDNDNASEADGFIQEARGVNGKIYVTFRQELTPGNFFTGVSTFDPPRLSDGIPYKLITALSAAPHCPEHANTLLAIEFPHTHENQTLWDCTDGERNQNVAVQGIVVSELAIARLSLFALDASGGMNLELHSADGSVLRSGFALGDQPAQINLQLNPGVYWAVVRGNDTNATYTLNIDL